MAKEFHVSAARMRTRAGSAERPLRRFSRLRLCAGDTIIVHEGVYREHVNPINGERVTRKITYEAARRKVVISGTEVITDW